MKLKDKVAIITGSTRGIGLAIAKAYINEGAKVVLLGSREQTVEKAKNEILAEYPNSQILPLVMDVQDTTSITNMVKKVLDKFGKIDILVNNAGISHTAPLFDMSDDDFVKVININLVGMFKTMREVGKAMQQNGGTIINTSSMVGTTPSPMQSAYSASKFGVNGLTRSAARELGKYNIRVNAVAPGVIATDMMENAVSDAQLSALKKMTPLGRIASPDELTAAYIYLACDDSKFTTGAIIPVDGGLIL